jgi:chitinase
MIAMQEVSPWDSDAVYSTGDQVLYKGRIYCANWWNRGDEPDLSVVWRAVAGLKQLQL